MITVEEALRIVLDAAQIRGNENRSITDSLGYVLDEDVVSGENVPSFDNSAMDGYAVIASDIAEATHDNPSSLKLMGMIRAGSVATLPLKAGQAYQIMTGAPIPQGANAVVMVEQTEKTNDGHVRIFSSALPNENVRRAGDDIKNGQTVFKKGRTIQPHDIGLLASIGRPEIRVISKPKLAVLSTGDELADIHTPLPSGKIRSSNNYTLHALARQYGIETTDLGIAKDTLEDTEERLQKAFLADIVLTSGGVSMGEFDFVREALKRIGVEIRFWKVKQKPGKPLVFGTFKDKLFFGLPGNPVSCAVCFELYAAPAIKKMSGYSALKPIQVKAISSQNIKKKHGLRYFLRGSLSRDHDRFSVAPAGNQSSGVLSSLSYANCLIDLAEEQGEVRSGDEVDCIPLNPYAFNELFNS
jgi:molybdopterin molybdotransferase